MSKVNVCPECTRNCTMIHGKKKNGLPVFSSFFKVMFGSQFSDLLFIPPKFARTVSTLLNQTVHLEDSSGRQWEVKVSEHDGSYTFHSGWNSFSNDHGLEIGDFLVFFYLGSHFSVKVYDRTGCEKLDLPKRSRSKKRQRNRKNKESSKSPRLASGKENWTNNQGSSVSVISKACPELAQCCLERNVVEAGAKQGASLCKGSQLLPTNGCTDELLCVSDRGIANVEEGEVRAVFDLSNFEVWKEKNSRSDDMLDKRGMLAGNCSTLQMSHDVCQLPDTEDCDSEIKDTITMCPEQVKISPALIQPKQGQMPAGVTDTATVIAETRGLAVREESSEDSKEITNFNAYVGREPSSFAAAKSSCIVKVTTGRGYNLDLPGNLPATFFRGSKIRGRKMLLLQDPMQRLWPVLYEETTEAKFLSNGWVGFSNANNVRPGDDCVFQVRDEAKSLFGVSIIRT